MDVIVKCLLTAGGFNASVTQWLVSKVDSQQEDPGLKHLFVFCSVLQYMFQCLHGFLADVFDPKVIS